MIKDNTILVRGKDEQLWRKIRSMDKLDELEQTTFGSIMEHVEYASATHGWELIPSMLNLLEPSIVQEYEKNKKRVQK